MHCMKCGTKISENQVFCSSCLEVMARYPVKPDSHVQLPTRSAPAKKAAPRKKLTPDAQLARARKLAKALATALTCALLALGLTISFLVQVIQEKEAQDNIGKNYSTVDTN